MTYSELRSDPEALKHTDHDGVGDFPIRIAGLQVVKTGKPHQLDVY